MGERQEDYKFSHQEVVEALIKQQGLHEGIWMLSMQFGIGAVNVANPDNHTELNPSAVVPVISIGLRKKDALNPLAVDASVVNPRQKSSKKKS